MTRDKPLIDFTDDELEQALSGSLFDLGLDDEAPDDGTPEVEPSSELQEVSRRIAGQYVEVLANFGSAAFALDLDSAACDEVVNALDALERLAIASRDQTQLELLRTLREDVNDQVEQGLKTVSSRFLTRLRRWFESYGECLSGVDSERLRRLVTYERGSIPLLAEISNIKGIGPKRLQRLYCAGLYTVEVVANADPVEVAQVTGLPRRLATKVVDATRDYAVTQRRRCVDRLHARTLEVEHMLAMSKGRIDGELLERLREASMRLTTCLLQAQPTQTPQHTDVVPVEIG